MKVSLLFCISDYNCFYQWAVQSAIANNNEIQLCIFNNGAPSDQNDLFAKDLGVHHLVLTSEQPIAKPEAFNKLLEACSGDYIVLVPFPVIFASDWLDNLLNCVKGISKTGLAGLYSSGEKGVFTHELSKSDEFISVWQPKTNVIDGIVAFNRDLLHVIGGLDPACGPLAIKHFATRASRTGYTNYYVANTSVIDLNEGIEKTDLLLAGNYEKYFEESIKTMASMRDFSTTYRGMSDNEARAYTELENLREKIHTSFSECFFLKLSETFGIRLNAIDPEKIKIIEEYAEKFNLWYMVAGPMKDAFYPHGITISFYSK